MRTELFITTPTKVFGGFSNLGEKKFSFHCERVTLLICDLLPRPRWGDPPLSKLQLQSLPV